MQGWSKYLVLGWLLLTGSSAWAELRVFACEPEWAALASALGGDRVTSYSATTAYQDPHRIEARPSLIARVRRADLLVCSGAELEVGWLPVLLRQAANAKVMPGQSGHFEASAMVERLDTRSQVDRSMGDVHAAGNPHVHLDPHRLLVIAKHLAERMMALDTEGTEHYRQRLDDFSLRWQQSIAQWESRVMPLKGMRVVVHHKDWAYLFNWLEIDVAGTLEPKPGLPTTVGHLAGLKRELEGNPARAIVHSAYQSERAARRLSGMSGIPVLELPYTVGGAKDVDDLFDLFEFTIQRLLEVAP